MAASGRVGEFPQPLPPARYYGENFTLRSLRLCQFNHTSSIFAQPASLKIIVADCTKKRSGGRRYLNVVAATTAAPEAAVAINRLLNDTSCARRKELCKIIPAKFRELSLIFPKFAGWLCMAGQVAWLPWGGICQTCRNNFSHLCTIGKVGGATPFNV